MSDPVKRAFELEAREMYSDEASQLAFVEGAMFANKCKPDGTRPVRAFPSSAISPEFGGMELRDWFAGMALAGLVSATCAEGEWSAVIAQPEIATKLAFELTDAMMAERNGSRGDA